MDNVLPKLHDDWMKNAAEVPKGLFSGGMGCRVFHISRINGLDLSPRSASAEETSFCPVNQAVDW